MTAFVHVVFYFLALFFLVLPLASATTNSTAWLVSVGTDCDADPLLCLDTQFVVNVTLRQGILVQPPPSTLALGESARIYIGSDQNGVLNGNITE